jgi:hypothetical protein
MTTAAPLVVLATRVASLVGCLAVGAPVPAPGAVSFATSAALGEGGEGSHLSGRARPPSFSSSSSPDDESSEVVKGESPLLLVQPELLISLLLALPPPDPLLFLARRPLLLPPLRRACARPGSGRGQVRLRSVHGHHLQRAGETPGHDDASQINRKKRGKNPLTNGP